MEMHQDTGVKILTLLYCTTCPTFCIICSFKQADNLFTGSSSEGQAIK